MTWTRLPLACGLLLSVCCSGCAVLDSMEASLYNRESSRPVARRPVARPRRVYDYRKLGTEPPRQEVDPLLAKKPADPPAPPAPARKPARKPARRRAPSAPSPAPVRKVRRHKVKKGETLQKIAKRYYGSYRYWTRIYEANKSHIRKPDLIFVGQVLIIP